MNENKAEIQEKMNINQWWHFLAKMYAKTKELGPMGGMRSACPPRSTNVNRLILNKFINK